MRTLLFIFSLTLLAGCREMMDETPDDPEAFSIRLLSTVRNDKLYRAKLDTLSNSSILALSEKLKTDDQRRAFWINLYNAFVQIRLKETPARFEKKELFFDEDLFRVGTARISLRDIEEGLLNRQFAKDFPKILRQLAVKNVDPRTYFALNCGATACPPIEYYESGELQQQLHVAEKVFVTGTSTYDPFSNIVHVSEFIQWHEEEFGGLDGVLRLMKRHRIIPSFAQPDLTYERYNWSPNVGNFGVSTY